MERLLPLVLFIPLAGSCLNGIYGRRGNHLLITLTGCISVALSFTISLPIFFHLLQVGEPLYFTLYDWLHSGDLKIGITLLFDPLSSVMTLTVTCIGLIIHIYSAGYMKGDRGYFRYFAYLNLFIFFMLLIVLSENIPLMFVGWEGVGLCSYLLIGFWFSDTEKAKAGLKAFIVNRIGDFGFLIGIFLLWRSLGDEASLSFTSLKSIFTERPDALSPEIVTAVTLLFFAGACGKSAQIPLYIWLPDAMAGPTPVSALIHAATMVTAGVYMVCRMNFLYALSPTTMTTVAIVGAFTAFLSATIATVQNDIKKILAYSTISQLGYMFVSCGVYAFSTGIFHLMTHAFFKALLFLGAGSIIHGLHGEQDIRRMGGLKDRLPITFWTFLIAFITICGVPPTSGFISKDEILFKTLTSPGDLFLSPSLPVYLFLLLFITGLLTVFYMSRLFFLTFFREFRGEKEVLKKVHESPPVMTVPLILLAFGSLFAGFLGLPEVFGGNENLQTFLKFNFKEIEILELEHSSELILIASMVGITLLTIYIAYNLYIKHPETPGRIASIFGGRPYRILLNKYYVDEIYDTIIVRPLVSMSRYLLYRVFDLTLIEGIVNGIPLIIRNSAGELKRIQTGRIYSYLSYFLGGAFLLLLIFILVR